MGGGGSSKEMKLKQCVEMDRLLIVTIFYEKHLSKNSQGKVQDEYVKIERIQKLNGVWADQGEVRFLYFL